MKLFFKFLWKAFAAFFKHQYLSVKLFFTNLFKAFYHPVEKKPVELDWKWRKFIEENASKPKFIGPTTDQNAQHKRKRRHRGGKKHRGRRHHHFNTNS